LANLCHNGAECYSSCQYAPPHEFAVNVPQVFARIRARSYQNYAWPGFVRVGAWWAVTAGIIVAAWLAGARSAAGANFYAVISHEAMVATFAFVSAFILAAYVAGFLRFWRESGESLAQFFQPSILLQAARDALWLKNLDSHGVGCTYPNQQHSQARRRFHHCTFYGFLLSLTGLLLLALRETTAMGTLLRIHLGIVLGLFLTLPYGKFVHGIYRSAALVRSVLEASRGKD